MNALNDVMKSMQSLQPPRPPHPPPCIFDESSSGPCRVVRIPWDDLGSCQRVGRVVESASWGKEGLVGNPGYTVGARCDILLAVLARDKRH